MTGVLGGLIGSLVAAVIQAATGYFVRAAVVYGFNFLNETVEVAGNIPLATTTEAGSFSDPSVAGYIIRGASDDEIYKHSFATGTFSQVSNSLQLSSPTCGSNVGVAGYFSNEMDPDSFESQFLKILYPSDTIAYISKYATRPGRWNASDPSVAFYFAEGRENTQDFGRIRRILFATEVNSTILTNALRSTSVNTSALIQPGVRILYMNGSSNLTSTNLTTLTSSTIGKLTLSPTNFSAMPNLSTNGFFLDADEIFKFNYATNTLSVSTVTPASSNSVTGYSNVQ